MSSNLRYFDLWHITFFIKRCSIREYPRDNSESFRSPLSEQDCGSNLEILWSIHKSEFDKAFVASSHKILIHVQYLSALSNDTTVDHSLVVRLDGCGVMENHYLSLEVMQGLWSDRLVEHYHAFSEASSFQGVFLYHTFDGEAYCLTSISFFNSKSLVMNRFYLNWLKKSRFIGSQVYNLIRNNCSCFKGSSNHETNTHYLIDSINVKFYWITWSLEKS